MDSNQKNRTKIAERLKRRGKMKTRVKTELFIYSPSIYGKLHACICIYIEITERTKKNNNNNIDRMIDAFLFEHMYIN